MDKRQIDYLSSGLFMFFGVLVLILTRTTVKVAGMAVIGPRAFPYFIGVSTIILSITLYLQTRAKYKGKEEELKSEDIQVTDKKDKENELRVVLLVAIAFAYVILFDKVGYFISTFAASTGIMMTLKVKSIKQYLVVYMTAIMIYFAFTKLLYVMLP